MSSTDVIELPSSALSWQISVQHCPSGGPCHMHPFVTRSGSPASFVAPDHADDTFLQITLTAVDSGGSSGSTQRNVSYKTIPLTLTTNPPGLQLLYGGTPVTAPFTTDAVVGGTRTIEAPTPQGTQTFVSWSDLGAAQHSIVVPNTATIIAVYATENFGRGMSNAPSALHQFTLTTSSTLPPCPPLPPSGPPDGLNFSRRIDTAPCPPLPAWMCSTARSTNAATISSCSVCLEMTWTMAWNAKPVIRSIQEYVTRSLT